MATREENLKKINAELEQLSDEELDQVVGGILTSYFFLYMDIGNGQVMYTKKPVGVGVGTSPLTVLKNNLELFDAAEKGDVLGVANYSDFRNDVQKYADKNASHWSNPLTYGNLVFSLNMATGKGERFEA